MNKRNLLFLVALGLSNNSFSNENKSFLYNLDNYTFSKDQFSSEDNNLCVGVFNTEIKLEKCIETPQIVGETGEEFKFDEIKKNIDLINERTGNSRRINFHIGLDFYFEYFKQKFFFGNKKIRQDERIGLRYAIFDQNNLTFNMGISYRELEVKNIEIDREINIGDKGESYLSLELIRKF